MRLPLLAVFSLATILAPAATAQISGPSLFWVGDSGIAVGSFFADCTPSVATVAPGESVEIAVSGDQNSAFGLFVSPSATSCISIPGVANHLVLDGPIVPVAAGVLTEWSPCLACPEAFVVMPLTVPMGASVGLSVSLQAVGFGWGQVAFTDAVVVTVQ